MDVGLWVCYEVSMEVTGCGDGCVGVGGVCVCVYFLFIHLFTTYLPRVAQFSQSCSNMGPCNTGPCLGVKVCE